MFDACESGDGHFDVLHGFCGGIFEIDLLKHFVLFAKLYADCVKFKPHWQLHVPTAVHRSGKILHPEVTPVAGLPGIQTTTNRSCGGMHHPLLSI